MCTGVAALLASAGCLAWLATSQAAPPATPGAASCSGRAPVAGLALRDDFGFLSVEAGIDGVPVRLMIDTGAEAGLLTPEAARRLRLRPQNGAAIRLEGTGGNQAALALVRARRLTLGPLTLLNVPFPVSSLPAAPNLSPPVVGLLGGDVLSGFGLEIDLPHRRLALWPLGQTPCDAEGQPAWRQVAMRRDGVRVGLDARLDGQPLTALLDTGARSRLVSTRAARRASVGPGALSLDPGGLTSGIDLRPELYHWHRFQRLDVAGQSDDRPVLTVAPLDGPADMLLGTDWLRTRAVWISHDRLYVRQGPQAPEPRSVLGSKSPFGNSRLQRSKPRGSAPSIRVAARSR